MENTDYYLLHEVSLSNRTMLQLTHLVTPWSFFLAIHQISSHLCRGHPIALTEIPWIMRCGVCSSNASTVAGFATSTTWNSVSSRSGVASTRTSLTEQFDSGMFDYAHVCANGSHFEHTLSLTDVSVYELLRRLFHIGNFCFWVPFLKQLLLRNCAVDFVEICTVYIGKTIIKAAKRIFISGKICRSYIDLNFGVTFLEHSVKSVCICQCVHLSVCPSASTLTVGHLGEKRTRERIRLSFTWPTLTSD